MTAKRALLIGNSDGIGLALTRLLLDEGYEVVGLSRSASPIEHERYRHEVGDVTAEDHVERIGRLAEMATGFPLCVYCAGMANEREEDWWAGEARVLDVNLLGAIRSFEALMPGWKKAGSGHFIALSSLADALHVPDAASYVGSKAGMSRWLESAGLHLRGSGIAISNLRFGFVDTKMARAPMRPFMLTTEKAARLILRVIHKRPLRASYPKSALLLVSLIAMISRPLIWFARGR